MDVSALSHQREGAVVLEASPELAVLVAASAFATQWVRTKLIRCRLRQHSDMCKCSHLRRPQIPVRPGQEATPTLVIAHTCVTACIDGHQTLATPSTPPRYRFRRRGAPPVERPTVWWQLRRALGSRRRSFQPGVGIKGLADNAFATESIGAMTCRAHWPVGTTSGRTSPASATRVHTVCSAHLFARLTSSPQSPAGARDALLSSPSVLNRRYLSAVFLGDRPPRQVRVHFPK